MERRLSDFETSVASYRYGSTSGPAARYRLAWNLPFALAS
jgi:uncharacterized protein (UPF0128 family)